MEWRQDQVKWSLPTTIAPKYGNASDLNLDDVTDPAISLLAENLFSFSMHVSGVLADSKINTPSHQIILKREEEETFITLKNEKDFMDKDIVFTFKTQKAREERSFSLVGKDFDGYAAIASFYPSFGKDLPKQPKSVTFVIDCSGSMTGVSIDRARTALHKALNLFTEEDSFNIIKFGSHHESLFESEVQATKENLNIAKRMVRSLDANMGGTEMEAALQSAYEGHKISKEKAGYLFLITDGEIYDHSSVIKSAKQSEMAHFVVGVGYASDDPLLRKIAAETRGSYESIDPNEKMDDYILNLFKKIDTPKALDVKVVWPIKTVIEYIPNVVFDGDTLYAYVTFNEKPAGEATLSYTLENGNQYSTVVCLAETMEEENPSTVSKLVMAKEIEALNAERTPERYYFDEDTDDEVSKKIIEISTKYQLFSRLTNYILVDEVAEDEKPVDLPEMHRVESMMVESGSVLMQASPAFGFASHASREMNVSSSERRSVINRSMLDDIEENSDILGDVTFEYLPEMNKSSVSEKLVSYTKNVLFSKSDEVLSSLEKQLDLLDEEEIEKMMMAFDKWYTQYGRIPRNKNDMKQLRIEAFIVDEINEKTFRKELRELLLLLMNRVDENILSEAFRAYLSKLQKNAGGLLEKIKEVFA